MLTSVSFLNSKYVYNIASKVALSENVAADLLAQEKIGNKMHTEVKCHRIQGQKKHLRQCEKEKDLHIQIVKYDCQKQH